MQSSSSGLNWEIDNVLKSEVWLAHEALKPMCDALSAHVGQSSEEDEVLLMRLSVLRDELEQLPRRGVQMCVVLVGPHLIGLIQLYCVSKNIFGKEKTVGKVDQVVDSLLETLKVLLQVIERVDAPFAESVSVCVARLLSNASLPVHTPPASPSTLSLISTPSLLSSRLFSSYSEDTRRRIAQIIFFTLQKASPIAISALSTQKHLTSLFYIVSQLLDIATYDRNRENQALAIQASLRVFNPSIQKIPITDAKSDIDTQVMLLENDHPSSEKRKFEKKSLASILPGTLSSTSKILLGDYKQGQEVFVGAFELLGEAICATLNDKENETLISSSNSSSGDHNTSKTTEDAMNKLRSIMSKVSVAEEVEEEKKTIGGLKSSQSDPKPKKDASESIGKVEMDGGWYKNAVYHVNMVLARIFSISRIISEETSKNVSMNVIVMRSVEVRKEMVKTVFKLLRRCSLTLASSFPHLFEIMILFSFDDHSEVSNLSNRLLEVVMNEYSKKSKNLLLFRSLFIPHLSKLVHSIPRIAMHPEDAKKLLLLRLLSGWIKNFPELFNSLLPSFIDSLITISQFIPFHISVSLLSPTLSLLPSSSDTQQTKNTENLAFSALAHTQQTYHHQFKLFRDPSIFRSIVTLIRLIGAMERTEKVFDLLLPSISFHSSFTYPISEDEPSHSTPESLQTRVPSSIFILNHIMMGSSGFIDFSNQTRFKLSSLAKSNLIAYWEHYLAVVMSEELWKCEDSRKGVFQLVLIMEGLGNMAMVFGKTFKKYFAKVLYRMLSMAGSEIEILSRVGKLTLVRFAEHTGFGDVVEMVRENSDYVVEEMTRELRYGEEVKGALNVFGGLLAISSSLIIHLMDDMIEDIFKRLDYRQQSMNESLLRILSQIIKISSNRIPASQPSRIQIKQANHLFKHRFNHSLLATSNQSSSSNGNRSNSSPSPSKHPSSSPSPSPSNSSLLDIYSNAPPTMHEWVRACELRYIGRSDLLHPSSQNATGIRSQSSDNQFSTISSSPSSGFGEEFLIEKKNPSQAHIPLPTGSLLYPMTSNDTLESLFKAHLVESYQVEEEMELLSKTGLSALSKGPNPATLASKGSEEGEQTTLLLGVWLEKRLEARKRESELFSPSSHSSASDGTAPASIGNYFKEHHAKKEEEEERGDDLHKGEEDQSAMANDVEDIHSDEEYEGVDYEGGNVGSSHQMKGVLKIRPHRPGFDMVLKILTRLQHWMNNENPMVRKLVLDSVKEGIEVLAEHKRVLLPFLHTIWSPLQWRFLDEDYRVVNEALEVMKVMTKYGKSFLARKFVDHLWPLLKLTANSYNIYLPEGLRNIAKMNVETQYRGDLAGFTSFSGKISPTPSESSGKVSSNDETYVKEDINTNDEEDRVQSGRKDEKKESNQKNQFIPSISSQDNLNHRYPASSTFFSSSSYKIQISMLKTLIYAIESLKLPEPVSLDIAQHTWFYLAQHQPKPLQEATIQLFGSLLASHNPNQTFYFLAQLHHSPIVPPPSLIHANPTSLSPISLPVIVPNNVLTPQKFKTNQSISEAFYSQFQHSTSTILGLNISDTPNTDPKSD